MWMPVFPAIFERLAGNLLNVDGSATQLRAILVVILLNVDAPLILDFSFRPTPPLYPTFRRATFHLLANVPGLVTPV